MALTAGQFRCTEGVKSSHLKFRLDVIMIAFFPRNIQ